MFKMSNTSNESDSPSKIGGNPVSSSQAVGDRVMNGAVFKDGSWITNSTEEDTSAIREPSFGRAVFNRMKSLEVADSQSRMPASYLTSSASPVKPVTSVINSVTTVTPNGNQATGTPQNLIAMETAPSWGAMNGILSRTSTSDFTSDGTSVPKSPTTRTLGMSTSETSVPSSMSRSRPPTYSSVIDQAVTYIPTADHHASSRSDYSESQINIKDMATDTPIATATQNLHQASETPMPRDTPNQSLRYSAETSVATTNESVTQAADSLIATATHKAPKPAEIPIIMLKQTSHSARGVTPGDDQCTYCHRLVQSEPKMILEELNIYCHTSCFKCKMCDCPLGDMLAGDNMWIHRGAVLCKACYTRTRAEWQP